MFLANEAVVSVRFVLLAMLNNDGGNAGRRVVFGEIIGSATSFTGALIAIDQTVREEDVRVLLAKSSWREEVVGLAGLASVEGQEFFTIEDLSFETDWAV